MEIKTLGELCDIVSGGTPSRSKAEFWNEGTIPWIKIGNIKGKYVNEADEFITQEGLAGSSAKMLAKGTVLYTIFATLGEVGILEIDACTNQAIAGLTIKDTNQLSTDYLYYYLRSKKAYVNNVGRGVAQNNINMSILRSFELPLPELSKQIEIVEIIDKVSKIIEARQQELECLDDLIKARFVEMFGDPVVHLDKDETVRLDTLAEKITVGFVGEASNEYVDEGVPYLRTQNVRVNRIDLAGLIYVNDKFHNKNQKSIIHPGDVVISRVGVNRGMAAMVPDTLPEANIANCLIVGRTDNINSYYLAFYMNMSFGKRPQFGASVGSAQGVVNTSILKKWEVFVPDRSLQDEFYEFAKQVDKSKVVVEKALNQAQLLFDSLMQKYFG